MRRKHFLLLFYTTIRCQQRRSTARGAVYHENKCGRTLKTRLTKVKTWLMTSQAPLATCREWNRISPKTSSLVTYFQCWMLPFLLYELKTTNEDVEELIYPMFIKCDWVLICCYLFKHKIPTSFAIVMSIIYKYSKYIINVVITKNNINDEINLKLVSEYSHNQMFVTILIYMDFQ